MIPTKTDTLAVNASHLAQFTLLDVRFLDPSDNTNVVYHLYVPIYVRKLLEYDFDVRVESGTNYYKNAISALNENNLIENMGVPVTLEFAYTYHLNRPQRAWSRSLPVYADPRTAPARGANRALPDIEPHLAGAKPHLKQKPVRNTNRLLSGISAMSLFKSPGNQYDSSQESL